MSVCPQSSKPSTPRGPGRPPVSSAQLPHHNSGLSGRPRPTSPPLKRRRLSISPDRTGAAPASSAPTAPAPAVSLPAALPPPPQPLPMPPLPLPVSSALPPPPPATSSMATTHSDLATAKAERQGTEPPASPAIEEPRTPQQQQQQVTPAALQQRDYGIKVEKVDLADEDEESLEATFSHVSNFEASQFEGSDHSAGSHDMSGLLGRVTDQGTLTTWTAYITEQDGSALDYIEKNTRMFMLRLFFSCRILSAKSIIIDGR